MVPVSVCITAYNVDKYISAAIDSALKQKTSFDYEIVIGEDKSTDSTCSILQEYLVKYPNRLRIINNSNNLGMMPNFIKTIESCRGKYIAVLDGDDYWLDENKLQKQFDILEKNLQYSLCWHDANIVNSAGQTISSFIGRFRSRNYNEPFDLLMVLKWKVLGPTSSIFFRNIISPLPDWAYRLYGTEALLFMLCRQVGELYFVNEISSAYRVHANSMESSLDKRAKALRNINEERILYSVFYPRFKKHFLRKITWNTFYLSVINIRSLNFTEGLINSFSLLMLLPKYFLANLIEKK